MAELTGAEGDIPVASDKKYHSTMALWYNDVDRRWQVGDLLADIWLTPELAVSSAHNINSLQITVTNRGHTNLYNNFTMGFDSIGASGDGKSIIYTKFGDACDQLEKNKANLERFLGANVDLGILRELRPVAVEFERRAAGTSVGNDALHFD